MYDKKLTIERLDKFRTNQTGATLNWVTCVRDHVLSPRTEKASAMKTDLACKITPYPPNSPQVIFPPFSVSLSSTS